MGLSRLDNFLKNSRGDILYVDPSSIDSTDSIENQGNSLVRPFKTIQRALIEAARFSYQKGLDNDRFSRTTIIVYPGDHTIDNRPGWIPIQDAPLSGNTWMTRGGSGASGLTEFTLDTNFNIESDDNDLYKVNSVYGGVIIPRGTSIVGLDLRKTKVRPRFVPNPEDGTIDRTCLFRVTGTCYFNQFTFFDADPNSLIYQDYGNNKFVPNKSHHKLTCFEYADGVNPVKFNDSYLNYNTTRTDLDMYYQKIGLLYGTSSGRDITPDFPDTGQDIQTKIDEFRIVGSQGQNIGISSIKAGDGNTATTEITVDITESITGLDVDTPIRIEGVPVGGYNGSFVINKVESSSRIKYNVSSAPANALPNIVSGSPTLNLVVDSVTSASPYIFNCSLRSVYGMCGLHADGDKADGFKSMVVAQFTGIGLQKDDNAFVKYNTTSGVYEDSNAVSNLHTDSRALYKPSYTNYHIKASNNAFLQLVSTFGIGYANHFVAESGGDHSITNSNSNFGSRAIVCKGFRADAFPRDDTGYVTHFIPPQEITTTDIGIEFLPVDVEKTVGVANSSRLYLYNEFNVNNPPNTVLEGYRLGAASHDDLKAIFNINGSQVTRKSRIILPDTQGTGTREVSSVKTTVVGRNTIGINSITSNIFTLTDSHQFINGESVRVMSDDGELPDGIDHNSVYFAITSGINSDQVKLAQTLNDTISLSPISVNSKGGILSIESRVSDKGSGDVGHPVQYDSTIGQWYVNTSTINNEIYDSVVGLGTSTLGSATPRTFISRKPDTRSLDDRIYKVRFVVPKDATVLSKPPTDSFVIQESSSTIGLTNSEVLKFNSIDPVQLNNTSELRNPRFISNAVWDAGIGTVGVATLTTEIPHELSVGSVVKVVNVLSGLNTTGVGDTGYNGEYTVTGRTSRREFTVGIKTDPGVFTNDTSSRTTSLPRYTRTQTKNTLFVYKKDEIQEYVSNVKDGVYHLTLIDASNRPSVEPFDEMRFAQPVKSLYPQMDRDNPVSDPNQTRTFALPSPIGLTEVNDPQNSLTKETINKNIRDFEVGVGIVEIESQSGTAHTLTTELDHNLNRVNVVAISSAGFGYGNGSGSIQTLFNANLVGIGTSVTGKNATANIKISPTGQITDVKIVDGGSAFGIGNTLAVVGVATTAGYVEGVVQVTHIHDATNEILNVEGIRDSVFDDYNNLYKVTSVPVGESNKVNVSSATTVYANYQFTGDTAIAGVNTNGLTKINNTILSDVTSYVTGETVGITSLTFDHVAGIASVTTGKSHGLLNNSTARVIGFNETIFNGSFTVTNVYTVNSFAINVGISTVAVVPTGTGSIYPTGFTAQAGAIDPANEFASARLSPQYAGITTAITVALTDPTINTLTVLNALKYNWNVGDYLIVDNEIMRISETVVQDTTLDVFRGLFGTQKQNHAIGAQIKRVKFKPIEFRRNSIIRASGHTFEYLGYGPGNYSTALPSRQDRQFRNVERVLSQSVSDNAGTPYYNGLDDQGNQYTVNKFTSGSTGQDLITGAPVPTIRGEDITSNSNAVGFDVEETDQITVNRSIKVDGGRDKNIVSEFNGPVVFNKKVTTNAPVEANSLFIQGTETIARKYSVGVSTPAISGNVGDITFDSEPSSGGTAGWVYTDDNNWMKFGPIQANPNGAYVGIFSGSFVGDGSQLQNVSDVWVFDGVGISTTAQVGIETTQAKSGYSLYAAGAVLFENSVEFRMDTVLWNVPDGWLINTGITTFNQQLNANTFRTVGVSTHEADVLITTNPATTGDSDGNFLRFVQTDTILNAAYKYGGIKWEGYDTGNEGTRGFIEGVSEGSSGQFGISFGTMESGASNPQERLRIAANGNITSTGTITVTSDESIKRDVETIPHAISTVQMLRGVNYIRKSSGLPETGLIAQEVEKVLPELVETHPDTGLKSVAYQNMVGLLIEAIKEQQLQIAELKERVNKLES